MSHVSQLPYQPYPAGLGEAHLAELTTESAVDRKVAAERGYATVVIERNDHSNIEHLKKLGIPEWALAGEGAFPGLLIPLWGPEGQVRGYQFKPRTPRVNADGKPMKYASQRGTASVLDVHPRWTRLSTAEVPEIRDAAIPLFIGEGIKKGDALTSLGITNVSLAGVYNWLSKGLRLAAWDEVQLEGRAIGIVFDADVVYNANVRKAAERLRKWLVTVRKARAVRYFIPPTEFNGKPIKGVDDFIAAGATKDDIMALASDRLPDPIEKGITAEVFADYDAAERYAERVLAGRFCYGEGRGWMQYTGTHWRRVGSEVPRNALGEFAKEMAEEARTRVTELVVARAKPEEIAKARDDLKGWTAAMGISRLNAAVDLAKGLPDLRVDVMEFDAHPDLLNTPSGVVDLRTGQVLEHDPDYYFTRITAVGYDPDACDEAFKAILGSVDPGALGWLQVHMGQAVTGHHGNRLVMLSGVGSNGKTKLMGVLTGALGAEDAHDAGYASIVPNTLLLNAHDRSGPTPEKMALLGLRFAYMEETPEAGILNTNMLKEVVDAASVSGRYMRQEIIKWKPSHTLFLNTNHPPQVPGTDIAIWRRLNRVDFPYRFRFSGDGLGEWNSKTDRAAMMGMGQALSTQAAQKAALAWLIEGARRWYDSWAAGEPIPTPAAVREATERWRQDTDEILSWFQESLISEPGAWIWTSVAYESFRQHATRNNPSGSVMKQKLFTQRLVGHTGIPAQIELRPGLRSTHPGLSVHPSAATDFDGIRFPSALRGPEGGRGWGLLGVRWRLAGE